jgi:hypothetical protein
MRASKLVAKTHGKAPISATRKIKVGIDSVSQPHGSDERPNTPITRHKIGETISTDQCGPIKTISDSAPTTGTRSGLSNLCDSRL